MKKITIALFLMIPTMAFAQNHPNMNQADMQNMMQNMQKMQECMEKIDQSQLAAIQKKSEAVGQEVNALCAQGKKDAAQARAMAWSKEIRKYPVIAEMKKCSEMYQGPGAMPAFDDPAKDFAQDNICDAK